MENEKLKVVIKVVSNDCILTRFDTTHSEVKMTISKQTFGCTFL